MSQCECSCQCRLQIVRAWPKIFGKASVLAMRSPSSHRALCPKLIISCRTAPGSPDHYDALYILSKFLPQRPPRLPDEQCTEVDPKCRRVSGLDVVPSISAVQWTYKTRSEVRPGSIATQERQDRSLHSSSTSRLICFVMPATCYETLSR